MMKLDDKINNLVDILLNCSNVTVLTGAGISAESGINTFRDPDGYWSKFNPQELASKDGFISNPEFVWSWYQYRLKVLHSSEPNSGHKSLVEFEKHIKQFNLVTQNVDGLHQKAGSKDVIELHGSIVRNKCIECNLPYHNSVFDGSQLLSKCYLCNGLIRPDVVWFGEFLPEEEINRAEVYSTECELFFSIGTSSEVYPAANLPSIAKNCGAFIVEINPNFTSLSSLADVRFEYPSGEILPKILEKYEMRIT